MPATVAPASSTGFPATADILPKAPLRVLATLSGPRCRPWRNVLRCLSHAPPQVDRALRQATPRRLSPAD